MNQLSVALELARCADEMAYVNLSFCDGGTQIHIRQFKSTDNGVMVVNDDGLTLSGDQFASLLYQLNAIEHSFLVTNNVLLNDTALFDESILFANNYEQSQDGEDATQ